MNLFILGNNPGLFHYAKNCNLLSSVIHQVFHCENTATLFRKIVRYSSTGPLLVLLDSYADYHNIIPRVTEFIPNATFLMLCKSKLEMELLQTKSHFSNLHVSLYDLYQAPPAKLKSLLLVYLGEEIIIPSSRFPLRYGQNEIIFLESERHRIRIHTAYHDDIIYSKLSEIHEYLGPQYLRCHQSYIVNIKSVVKLEEGYCVLENDEVIPISRPYQTSMRRIFRSLHPQKLTNSNVKNSTGRGRRRKV